MRPDQERPFIYIYTGFLMVESRRVALVWMGPYVFSSVTYFKRKWTQLHEVKKRSELTITYNIINANVTVSSHRNIT